MFRYYTDNDAPLECELVAFWAVGPMGWGPELDNSCDWDSDTLYRAMMYGYADSEEDRAALEKVFPLAEAPFRQLEAEVDAK